ncbi:MAG: flippase-like domain-containing protein [Elusimicrobia bacterium]|nr:flippase-like domain-containing protein [Elusimicrobiota bacterium]
MKKLSILFLICGIIIFSVILYNLDIITVLDSLSRVKWGFIIIFSQEIVAHIFNTCGWKYAIDSELKIKISFKKLLLMRIAGDGINYVTPSATLVGEFAKAHMMGKNHSLTHRLSTVALAKITQAIALCFISIAAITWLLVGNFNIAGLSGQMKIATYIIALLFAIIIFMEARANKTDDSETAEKKTGKPKTLLEKVKELDKTMMLFIKKKPKEFALSTFFFTLAYLWGAVEAYLIAYFLGIPVTFAIACLIELLSVFLDGLFFAVPLKAGTQEATKVAIFSTLGMSAALGFSFAVVRHLRELLWSFTGVLIFYRIKNAENH